MNRGSVLRSVIPRFPFAAPGSSFPSLCVALSILATFAGGCVPPDPEPVKIGELACDLLDEYPEPPYGVVTCDRIANHCFEPANDGAVALAGEDGTFALSDIFADESIQGVLLFGTAGWCAYCSQEAAWLNEIYENLQEIDEDGGRVEVVAVVFEDDFGNPVDQAYAEAYAAHKGLRFPAVADSTKSILSYFDASGAPGNIFISREGMTIRQVLQGFDQSALERAIAGLDGSLACQ